MKDALRAQHRIRRSISSAGIAIGLVCIGLDFRRGGPAFWPMLTMLGWMVLIAVVRELGDRRERGQ